MNENNGSKPNLRAVPGMVSGDLSLLDKLPKKQPETAPPPQGMAMTPGMLIAMIASLICFGGSEREKILSLSVEALCKERHEKNHVTATKPEKDFRKCENPVCRDFTKILDQPTENYQAVIQRFQFDMALRKMIFFQPLPPNHFRIFVQDKPQVELATEMPGGLFKQ
jgi:hypothetical protein